MQLGIVSDTHDNLAIVESAVEVFEREGVDSVVHCGDFVAPFSAAAFDVATASEGDAEGFGFHAVRGNNDGEWALQNVVGEFGTYHGEMAELTFDGREFAVYHGTSEAIVDALVDCGHYDYVLHGHTHEFAHEEGETTRINPGGIPIGTAPDAPTAVVLDLDSDSVEAFKLG